MSSDAALRSIRVEAFRGFRDRRELDLDASAVVISGPNGTGKTSLFDAIQWCLVGSLDRLEEHRSRKTTEHIVNQYRSGERATVELELVLEGQSVSIRRRGDHAGSTLELRVESGESLLGELAERQLQELLAPRIGLELKLALTTSGLMQQDVMRSILEAKPAERYRHLSTVLGLGDLERFEEELREAAKEAKVAASGATTDADETGNELAEARSRAELARQRMERLPRVDVLAEELSALLVASESSGLKFREGATPASTSDLRELSLQVGQLVRLAAALESTEAALARALEDSPEALPLASQEEARTNLRRAEADLLASEEDAQTARAELLAAENASEEMAQLAALAIPLLAATCPICGQGIDAEHVGEELRRRSGETETVLGLRERVASAEAGVASEATRLAQALNAVRQLDRAVIRLNEIDELQAKVDSSRREMESMSGPLEARFGGSSRAQTAECARLLEAVDRRLHQMIDSVDLDSYRGEVETSESEVVRIERKAQSRAERASEMVARARSLKALADSSIEARVDITKERFAAVQPLVADIYSRLDPHPAFKSIEFELETYYKRGRTSPLVRDLLEDVTADPLLVFSTSQANIAALSYFLAMGLSAGDRALPFVMLDDPVQSMDDVNVLGFADLCRHLRRGRQLVISTHERRFANLLQRKLAPRVDGESLIVTRFVGWDRSGPVIEVERSATELVDPMPSILRSAS